MKSLFSNRMFGSTVEEVTPLAASVNATPVKSAPAQAPSATPEETTMLRTIAWISAGLGAVALGLVVGRELRQRYKFNRRTPYDFYAHSGDEMQDVEFGVGI
ncbi:hypothetical protein FTO74_01120 [Granulicella sp. WH15]|uniref:hypothetical protein n=1 Tax=Granulicella sp. WH15 TaxID=2602070 RepID=UPI0013677D72|nr:hypothetical protein [Granulicella sp. WH15]QHN02136.1 hypothetical protein FTO74_01120 [Granulicella sp. WH15]